MKKIFLLFLIIVLTGCSLVGIRDTQEPTYELLLREGLYELRSYPSILVAETVTEGDYKSAGNAAFRRLAAYIFGDNRTRDTLAMTTPVIREVESEEIAMTAPVIQQVENESWRMSFVMPPSFTIETLPVPTDSHIEFRQLPAKKVAVLIYSGTLEEKSISGNGQKLLDWLKMRSINPVSSIRSAAYDPPWTIPQLRRNEIHVDIE